MQTGFEVFGGHPDYQLYLNQPITEGDRFRGPEYKGWLVQYFSSVEVDHMVWKENYRKYLVIF